MARTAGRLAHGLLGVAGSLRLRDMYSLAVALDGALRGRGDVGLAVRELEACMTEVLDTIASLPPPSSRRVGVTSSRPPPRPV